MLEVSAAIIQSSGDVGFPVTVVMISLQVTPGVSCSQEDKDLVLAGKWSS